MLALSSMACIAHSEEQDFSNHVQVETKYDFGFNFVVLSGTRHFLPIQAFTDGKKTWIQFRPTTRMALSFADGQPVSGRMEGMYYVVDGVYSSMNFIDAITNSNIVMVYDGVHQMKKQAALYSAGSPMAINGVAALPVEIQKAPPPPKFTLSPSPSAVSTVQAPAPKMSGFFSVAKIAPTVNEVGCAVNVEPVSTANKSYMLDKSFFVSTSDKNAEVEFDKSVIDALKAAAASGKKIRITGVAGTQTEVGRVGRANLRAINAKMELNNNGINDESLSVVNLKNYPAQDYRSGIEFKILKVGA